MVNRLYLIPVILATCLIVCSSSPAGGQGRRAGAPEEVDHLPQSPAPVLPARRRLPLQHHPGHVRPEANGGRLGEHRLLRGLHLPVVSPGPAPSHRTSFTFCYLFYVLIMYLIYDGTASLWLHLFIFFAETSTVYVKNNIGRVGVFTSL